MSGVKYSGFSTMNLPRLRFWLVLFFLAIAIPAALLIQQTYSQLKWEALHQQRLLATELTERIEMRFADIINTEQARPFTDYAFLNVAGDPSANFLQRSPISSFPVATTIAGLIGYFQIDTSGKFTTPLVPTDLSSISNYGISETELAGRKALQQQVYQILSQNSLLDESISSTDKQLKEEEEIFAAHSLAEEKEAGSALTTVAEVDTSTITSPAIIKQAKKEKPVKSQAAFDKLEQTSSATSSELSKTLGQLQNRRSVESDDIQQKPSKPVLSNMSPSKTRTEVSSLPVIGSSQETLDDRRLRQEQLATIESAARQQATIAPQLTVLTFESEIDPLVFRQLDSGQFVLFRKVWRNGDRIIQGLLLDRTVFLDSVVNNTFQQTGLSLSSKLALSYRDTTVAEYQRQNSHDSLARNRDNKFEGQTLYQSRLNDPFSELELLFTINNLPSGPAVKVVALQAVILILVLTTGFYLMYRLGARQIQLAQQQQDFVSAVSHELKTPLTSIRMYGEMLKQGWVSDDKKVEYYNYIYDESERLSRLVNNVLQLARMSRNEQQAMWSHKSVNELMALVESKVSSQVKHAGFTLKLDCSVTGELNIDVDWFTQIVLNLVDNAIKFSANATNKSIEISCRKLHNNNILFSVRDYGPGIKKEQMKSIFKLFYRSENELSRETVGTGIGLSLVHQMTQAMGGEIDVVNKKPGAEFRISFPAIVEP